MKIYTDVRLANPFLRPSWRHERVLSLLSSVPIGRCKRYDDTWIQQYRKFLFTWRRGESYREALLHKNPGLYFAYMIYVHSDIDPDMRLILEARLLAGSPIAEIADNLKTLPETVKWYEKLFFNVSDFLTHHDWIVKQVLLPASDRAVLSNTAATYMLTAEDETANDNDDEVIAAAINRTPEIVKPYMDSTLKFFSYFGGPLVCDIMISGFRRNAHVTSAEDVSEFFNAQYMSQIQRRSAQAAGQFEINKYNVMELFSTHSQIIAIQQSSASTEEQHSEIEKHVSSMLEELTWATGTQGKNSQKGTQLGKLDNYAAELDSDELLKQGAGLDPELTESLSELTIHSRKEIELDEKTK